MAAAAGGDLDALVSALAPDVVLVTDGGGLRSAARRPILGRDKVVRFLVGIGRDTEPTLHSAVVNGAQALVVRRGDEVDTVATFRVEDGAITDIYAVRNPEKLGGFSAGRALARRR